VNFQKPNFSYKYQPRRPPPDRARKAKTVAIGDLLRATLSKHGIAHQVESAMIVKRAEEELKRATDPHMHLDFRVVSYKYSKLFVACIYPETVQALRPLAEGLKDAVLRAFPAIQLTEVEIALRPESVRERD
jgi:hypothetical protein